MNTHTYTVGIMYPAEFGHSYRLTLTSESSEPSHEHALETVFGQWNAGSGCECKDFLKSGKRSLSPNDIVRINDRYYQCMSVGWKAISPNYVAKLEFAVQKKVRNTPGKYPWTALANIMDSYRSGDIFQDIK